jgi:hypothetical protein
MMASSTALPLTSVSAEIERPCHDVSHAHVVMAVLLLLLLLLASGLAR